MGSLFVPFPWVKLNAMLVLTVNTVLKMQTAQISPNVKKWIAIMVAAEHGKADLSVLFLLVVGLQSQKRQKQEQRGNLEVIPWIYFLRSSWAAWAKKQRMILAKKKKKKKKKKFLKKKKKKKKKKKVLCVD